MEAPVLAARLILQVPLEQSTTGFGSSTWYYPWHQRVAHSQWNGHWASNDAKICRFSRYCLSRTSDLFSIHVRKRKPLYRMVVEVEERVAADGSILVPLNLSQAGQRLNSFDCKVSNRLQSVCYTAIGMRITNKPLQGLRMRLVFDMSAPAIRLQG